MKREEQNKEMRERILHTAILEFNEQEYTNASMNHICARGDMSKGILYHYFKDKDDLYLTCVRLCYQKMVDFYTQQKLTYQTIEEGMNQFLSIRFHFFESYPELKGLFFNAMLKTPEYLIDEVEKEKKALDDMTTEFYTTLLGQVKLKSSITKEKAVHYLMIQQNMFNDYFRKEVQGESDFNSLVQQHEELMIDWIHYILYGIAKEEEL